ncbi:hypothetical protein P152DRAFT_101100 [Eremomyces bilateralis CBS 781.70]|uniref:Flavodoxin domain-containing protein n=1 Tax=Eremomyces bilateralis CBS 781.70 TaxID=1392243 RepID=A0A6G1FWP6_9PEZI|nr:uncharacterized protein P152DRAFT_101100 [Eremomyces bilateralis CBS 781.70]KAF1810158.1 hypothetical protein P152DRAFT_101100 [Eremomyces bilateralis CBS 781.70]
MSVLIAYATSRGSTGEIANRIASRLETFIKPVTCLPVSEVQPGSLPSYSVIVVASAIHAGSWINPGHCFVRTNKAVLQSKPVWAFSVGMPPTDEEHAAEEKAVAASLRKDLPDLRGHTLFQGAFFKEDMPWWMGMFIRFIPKERQKWGDARNWEEIEGWADKLRNEVKALNKS